LRKALTIKVAAQRGFGFDYCKEGWIVKKLGNYIP
jgi:hypothetical protein